MTTISINGITYKVILMQEFSHNGKTRFALRLQRPNGKRVYHAVQYETGSVSSAV